MNLIEETVNNIKNRLFECIKYSRKNNSMQKYHQSLKPIFKIETKNSVLLSQKIIKFKTKSKYSNNSSMMILNNKLNNPQTCHTSDKLKNLNKIKFNSNKSINWVKWQMALSSGIIKRTWKINIKIIYLLGISINYKNNKKSTNNCLISNKFLNIN